ncbi:T9SS type A sorting domain-containing protein [Sanyastnella coralliicola]|uniref:T9SS type A sorting domain-containing protein n=1 Tax=Sanyastnella coralliicola TaxID=3069118 RepID=UPI0027BAA619|nr:T9SS type A sorting domain-containing protein [Longitalea sp. SCSIO 12813]
MRNLTTILILFCAFHVNSQWVLDEAYGSFGHAHINEAWFELPVALISSAEHEMVVSQWIHEENYFESEIGITLLDHDGNVVDAFPVTHESYDHVIPREVEILAGEKVLVIGECFDLDVPNQIEPFAVMLTNTGEVVTAYANQGWMTTEFLGIDEAFNGLHATDEQVVLAGFSLDSNYIHRETPVLMLLDSEGFPEESFGTHGKIALDFSDNTVNDTIRHENGGFFADALLTDDRIYAVGAYNNSLYYTCLIAAFDYHGQLDLTFSDDGIFTIDYIPYANNWFNAVHLAPNGELICNVFSEGETDGSLSFLRIGTEGSIAGVTEFNASAELIFEDMTKLSSGEWAVTARCLAGEENAYNSDQLSLFIIDPAFEEEVYSVQLEDNMTTLTGMELTEGQNGELYVCAYAEGAMTDEFLYRFEYMVGMNEINPSFNLYPNPASTSFTIEGRDQYSVYNTAGQLIEQISAQGAVVTVDCSRYPDGVYFVHSNEGGCQKLIVR